MNVDAINSETVGPVAANWANRNAKATAHAQGPSADSEPEQPAAPPPSEN